MFCNAKEHLLHIKRASFTPQKGMFYIAKDALLECKRYSIQTLTVILFYKHKSYPDGR